MTINFVKMQGAGNDYIYIDCLEKEYDNKEEIARILSDRHFGVGGDGVVFICKSDVADATMRMFNLDGSEGKMCGNAIRCVAKYLYDNKKVSKKIVTIETLSGIKTLSLNVENDKVSSVKVDMGKAIVSPSEIPVAINQDIVISYPVNIAGTNYNITCVSMGNPHAVIFGEDPDNINLEKIGPLFEKNELFPESINTEFVEVIDRNTLKMRVWERGSGETLACGTGACATVVASVLNGYCDRNTDVKVILRGGELTIRYTDETVFMTGPCVTVFTGVVEI